MIKELDEGYPVQYLRSVRREMADAMKASNMPPTDAQITALAAVHQAIAALEAVIEEVRAGL